MSDTINEFDWLFYINNNNLHELDTEEKALKHWTDIGVHNKLTCANPRISKPNADIMAFCTYFPQFHSVEENNISFYEGFTDIKNLDILSEMDPTIQIESPSTSELNIESMLDYDLISTPHIIQKQIDLITEYNISGFAIYYYWFSTNTITNKHMIMKDVMDRFFDDSIDMNTRKVYFIWANESWSKNPAFGKTDHKIENAYNSKTIQKNIDNLMSYFKHDNYLKLDNKPVLYVHHPWFIEPHNMDLLIRLMDSDCRSNGFDGVYLVFNSMFGMIDTKYLYYDHHPNYKNTKHIFRNKELNRSELDYAKYAETATFNKNNNQTLYFDFDNRARLSRPNRINMSTVCINNDIKSQLLFANKISNHYNGSSKPIKKILLINAWNEWGERMHIEPSEQKGRKYLDIIKNTILTKYQ